MRGASASRRRRATVRRRPVGRPAPAVLGATATGGKGGLRVPAAVAPPGGRPAPTSPHAQAAPTGLGPAVRPALLRRVTPGNSAAARRGVTPQRSIER